MDRKEKFTAVMESIRAKREGKKRKRQEEARQAVEAAAAARDKDDNGGDERDKAYCFLCGATDVRVTRHLLQTHNVPNERVKAVKNLLPLLRYIKEKEDREAAYKKYLDSQKVVCSICHEPKRNIRKHIKDKHHHPTESPEYRRANAESKVQSVADMLPPPSSVCRELEAQNVADAPPTAPPPPPPSATVSTPPPEEDDNPAAAETSPPPPENDKEEVEKEADEERDEDERVSSSPSSSSSSASSSSSSTTTNPFLVHLSAFKLEIEGRKMKRCQVRSYMSSTKIIYTQFKQAGEFLACKTTAESTRFLRDNFTLHGLTQGPTSIVTMLATARKFTHFLRALYDGARVVEPLLAHLSQLRQTYSTRASVYESVRHHEKEATTVTDEEVAEILRHPGLAGAVAKLRACEGKDHTVLNVRDTQSVRSHITVRILSSTGCRPQSVTDISLFDLEHVEQREDEPNEFILRVHAPHKTCKAFGQVRLSLHKRIVDDMRLYAKHTPFYLTKDVHPMIHPLFPSLRSNRDGDALLPIIAASATIEEVFPRAGDSGDALSPKDVAKYSEVIANLMTKEISLNNKNTINNDVKDAGLLIGRKKLTPTNFRVTLATKGRELPDEDRRRLAKSMNHSFDVHDKRYSLAAKTKEATRVSTRLRAHQITL